MNVQLNWRNRKCNVSYQMANVSVDGTDLVIKEPSPFDSKWFSHKTNGPGVRYEIGIQIHTGIAVWAHGPFPCGSYTDLRIFRLRMKLLLDDGEKVIADRGYPDGKVINPDSEANMYSTFNATVRARHETFNSRLKSFAILGDRYRHDIRLHSDVFFSVLNLVHLSIVHFNPLFQV